MKFILISRPVEGGIFIEAYVSHPDASVSWCIIDNYSYYINKSSELTTVEKQVVNGSLSVASASSELWTEVYSNN